MWRSVALRVLTLLFTGRHQNLTRKSVEIGLANKWSSILEVMNVCKLMNVDETWNLRLKRIGHRSQEKMGVIPHHQDRQDVEMPVEAPVESASVKRRSHAAADNEERARLRLRAECKRGQKHEKSDVLEPQAKTKARSEPRRGQKRESTQPLPDLQEEVTSTVLVTIGPPPNQGGSSSSADVVVNSSVATSVSVEYMIQTDASTSTSVGTQPASAFTIGTLCKESQRL